ncbi:hypothetical protein [Halocatena halophila]|uniref:hypothetical protein n=1 Tax=Halocatena halophila TaxID=2814576 RepID=UPI002ED325A8
MISDIFTITNQGPQPVGVWLENTNDVVEFQQDGTPFESEENAVQLSPGDTIYVGVEIDATDSGEQSLETELVVNADADLEGGATNPNTSNSDRTTQTGTERQSDSNTRTTPNQEPAVNETEQGLIDGLMDLIQSGSEFFQKHKATLIRAALLTPHPIGYIVAWMLLHPKESREILVGAAAGAMGMPNGIKPTQEAGTVTYFAGWMITSVVPIVGIIPDIRDTIQAALNGDIIGSVIGLASIAPGLGTGGDLAQIGHYAKMWAKIGGSNIKKAVSFVKDGILSRFPDSIKRDILDGLSKGKKAEKISDSKMQRYIDDGYNPAQIDDLVKNSKFTKTDIDQFTKKGVNLDRVQTLRGRNIPADDIRYYVKNDVSLHKVADMRNQKFSPKRIRKLSKQGFDFDAAKLLKRDGFTNDHVMEIADTGIKPSKARQLKHDGFTHGEVVGLAKKGANVDEASRLIRGDFTHREITGIVSKSETSYLRTGDVLKQVRKRYDEGIPKKDIKHYVDEGVSLKLVGKIHTGGQSPRTVRNAISEYIRVNPDTTRQIIESLSYGQRKIAPTINTIVNGYASTKVRKNKSENKHSRQIIPLYLYPRI